MSQFDQLVHKRGSDLDAIKRYRTARFFLRDSSAVRENLSKVLKGVIVQSGKDRVRVLDLGCGDGEYSRALAESPASLVIGLDSSLESLRIAKEKVPRTADFVLGDCRFMPFRRDSFDLLVIVGVLHHLGDYEMLRSASEVVSVSGEISITEEVSDNPLYNISFKVFKMLKASHRARLLDTDNHGGVPDIYDIRSDALERALKANGLFIKQYRPGHLFLFLIWYLIMLLPVLDRLIPTSLLESLENLEQHLLRHFRIRKHCREVSYVCAKTNPVAP